MKRGLSILVLLCVGCGGDDPTNPQPVEIGLEPSVVMVEVGATRQFQVTVTGTANVQVTWSVVEGLEHGTIDSTGLYTAPLRMPGSGTATVQVGSMADPRVSATAEVVLSAHQQICGLVTYRQVPVEFETLKGKWFAEIMGVNATAEYLWFESDQEIRLAIVESRDPADPQVSPDCRLIATSVVETSTMETRFAGGPILTRWRPEGEPCCDTDYYGSDVLQLESAIVLDDYLARIPVLVEVLDPDAPHCSRFPGVSPKLRPVLEECIWE